MRPQDIDRFFARLAQKVTFPAVIVLTGGGAGILEGVERVTRDLDFQITLGKTSAEREALFEKAAQDASKETGILAQYDTSIESWSSIAWPSSKPKSRLYRRFGNLEVRLLDPLFWSVGKLARALSSDISDVITVFRRLRVKPMAVARAWGEALGRSPMSSAQPLFKQQVIHFFKMYTHSIWGKSVDPQAMTDLFLGTAQKTHQTQKKS